MNWLNFHHLLYFREIALHGSMVKAAETLKISTPALSAQLKLLEESLGSQLFDRKGRGLILNDFGKMVFEYAEQTYEIGQMLINSVNMHTNSNNLKISMGFTDALSKSISRNIVMDLREQMSSVRVSLSESKQQLLVKSLLSHDLDIIFTNRICLDDKGDIFSKNYSSEKVCLYGTENFAHLKDRFPDSLNEMPFIMPSLTSDMRHSVDQWFIDKKIKYNMVAEVEDSAVEKLLAVKGVGLVPLPENGARDLVRDKKLIKIGELDDVVESYYFTVKKHRVIKNPAVEFLIEFLSNKKA